MSQVTSWKCDRCGATEAVRDQSMPKTNSLPKDWGTLSRTGPPQHYDLCAKCAKKALTPIPEKE